MVSDDPESFADLDGHWWTAGDLGKAIQGALAKLESSPTIKLADGIAGQVLKTINPLASSPLQSANSVATTLQMGNATGACMDSCSVSQKVDAISGDVKTGAELALALAGGAGLGASALSRTATTLSDEALVVRGGSGAPGGANSVEGIAKGTGTHPDGVTGFSAESADGKSMEQLIKESPTTSRYSQVGCCKVGDVRAAGGDVKVTAGASPNHATVTGLTPEQANKLLTPTVPNPVQ
jgi:hypothetical protein